MESRDILARRHPKGTWCRLKVVIFRPKPRNWDGKARYMQNWRTNKKKLDTNHGGLRHCDGKARYTEN